VVLLEEVYESHLATGASRGRANYCQWMTGVFRLFHSSTTSKLSEISEPARQRCERGSASISTQTHPELSFEPSHRLRRSSQSRLVLRLHSLPEKPPPQRPFQRSLRSNVDIAVIRVTDKSMPVTLKLPTQFIEEDFAQERREQCHELGCLMIGP